MKKLIALLLALVMILSMTACGGSAAPAATEAPKADAPAAEAPAAPAEPAGIDGEIAVFWYTFGDTYLSSVRAAMNEAFAAAGLEYHDYDANGSQTTQSEQIQTYQKIRKIRRL